MSDSEATVNFDKLKLKLASLTWSVITSLWQKERSSREEWENKAFAILELRDMVKTEIIDLIKQQRLLYLTEGTRFDKYSNKGINN
jgi:engulfment/cell motility protein 1